MLKFNIPQISDKNLFETTLEPIDTEVEKLVKKKGMGEGEINTFHGKKNKVAVGMPYYENLISRYIAKDEEISHEIKRLMADYDFHFLSLSCSFLPDIDCRFVWARFGVELSAKSKSGELLKEKPIAWDMFPDEISSEIPYMRKVNISPKLTLKLGGVDADIKLMDIKSKKNYVIYEPEIYAGGIRRSNVSWNFKRTKEKEIFGNKKNLLLIVKSPKNSKVKGRFLLGAEVEYNILPGIPIPISKKKDNVVDEEYDLSE